VTDPLTPAEDEAFPALTARQLLEESVGSYRPTTSLAVAIGSAARRPEAPGQIHGDHALKPTQRAKVKKIRAAKGIRAAIKAATKLSS
jgi:hypothetical protein